MAGKRAFRRAIASSLCAVALMLTVGPVAWAQKKELSSVSGRVPQPVIEPARGGQCVEDPAFMRRNHMQLLKHQRDETVHGGVRAAKYSLKACIDCHASKATGSVTVANTNFCQSCHSYAAVKIDCFECHASKPAQSSFLPIAPHGQAGTHALSQQLRQLVTQQQAKP